MPQGPILVADANLIPQGAKSVKNITTPTVLKATPGTVLGIAILVAGTAGTCAIYDANTTSGNTAANEVWTILNTTAAGGQLINPIPCNTGILVVPATGQTLAVWYI